MRPRPPLCRRDPLLHHLLAVAALLVAAPAAQDLGGGAPCSHGRVAHLRFEPPQGDGTGAFAFEDLPPDARRLVGLFSPREASIPLPPVGGTLHVDLGDRNAVVLPFPSPRLEL